ncbi:efflux RND transporter periplasmic adaptor subunit [Pokkaliibacter sp. CJK22405]|uniref:efflux RND transporter periplasmic adaptor subunit n=1 Tax=Pokkaliibacter sp. CJK22405 TaxID=3384615 RepID=UPI0039853224
MTDTANNQAQNEQQGKNSRKRKVYFIGLILVLAAAGLGVYFYHETYGRFYESTDDAYVDGNLIELTPQVSGTVVSIAVDNGDFVEKGQTLVQLDPSDSEVQLQSAEAELAHTVRQVRGLYSNVDGYKAQVSEKQVEVQRAEADYARRLKLSKGGAISKEDLAHARDALNAARSALTNAKQQLDSNAALVDDTVLSSHPEIRAAAAKVKQAYLAHERTTIKAPESGYIAQRSVQLGKHVQPGAALMAVVPLHQVWIDANFKETQLRDMRIGQEVEVESDLYGDDIVYRGKVESLGVGTGSAFSLLPAQNASGNWIKIVQRLPVRIRLEGDNLQKHPLRIGLSTKVTVDLHNQDGALLPPKSPDEPRYETNVYDRQIAAADELIKQLIHDNGPAAVAMADTEVAKH